MNAGALDERASTRPLWQAAAITAITALIANLAIYGLTRALVDVPHRFTPLRPGSVAFLTILGVIAATAVYRALSSRSTQPVLTFRRIVPVALIVSLIPDALIWATGAYGGTATSKTVLPLMAMHVAAAAACWSLLPRRAANS